VDPLAEKYVAYSGYSYAANQPTNAVDDDGRRIIFINGKIGGGSPPPGEPYWGGRNGSFVKGAQQYFGDYTNPQFIPYQPTYLSSAKDRTEEGREYAKEHLAELTAGLQDGEQFRIVSHSMGGAFAEGVIEVLKENGYIVAQSVFINTFQAADIADNQDAAKGTGVTDFSIDYQNTDDPVINNPIRSSPGYMKGVSMTIGQPSGVKDIREKHASPIWRGAQFWKDLTTAVQKGFDTRKLIDELLQQNPNIKVTGQ
jgi:hypothetical protein